MSLDNFQLPTHLLSELYKNSLVVLDDKQINTESLKEENFVFLGNNHKNILIVVEDAEAVHVNDQDLNFLIGILTACKLTIADIALLNMTNHQKNYFEAAIQHFNPDTIILFNIESKKSNSLDIVGNKYQTEKKNGIQILSASSLHQISNNIEEKKKLWNCLKNLFNV